MRFDNRRRLRGIIPLAAAIVACAAHGAPPGQSGQSAESAQPASTLDPAVDKILDRLEERKVEDITANVTWITSDVFTDSKSVKLGSVQYRDMEPAAGFIVRFDKFEAGGRRRPLNEQHMFDGRWYVELDSEKRTFTKREMRYEDKIGDPYSLGEGLFPVPFGQKKSEILENFAVTREPPDEKLDPKGLETDHLKLVPRSGTRLERKYNWIDFWIARGGEHDGLPVKVRLAKNEGTGQVSQYVIAEFSDVKLNRGISPSVFKLEAPEGYLVEVERLPGRDGGAPPAPSPNGP